MAEIECAAGSADGCSFFEWFFSAQAHKNNSKNRARTRFERLCDFINVSIFVFVRKPTKPYEKSVVKITRFFVIAITALLIHSLCVFFYLGTAVALFIHDNDYDLVR